ncbi:Translation initiation factor IF2/IF5 [Artemisia annua]|uniref:Translation initiation factor IF2/IF5 n=1 Tax=Artemisia annua TaxID=35608 RepID=A0A2U1KFX7_ARTAN|nr:Translation initiation factor IF2/IF5 [Artemisia annua]
MVSPIQICRLLKCSLVILNSMHRKPEHVMTFLEAELGTNGSLDSYHKLEVNGRFVPKNLEGALKRYADEYVTCRGYWCQSPNSTVLSKEDGIWCVRCKKCKNRRYLRQG